MGAASFNFDPAAFEPLIEQVVERMLARVQAGENQLNGKLAYSEPEAAALLSLAPHQLRDARLRGEINASRGPKGKILYGKTDLLTYLARGRSGVKDKGSKTEETD
jgi:hypothetical protein